jgi:putative flavoprotein involved in K+ transport
MRKTETIVVGAGQAGLALSRYLARAGHDHAVLERGRVGERWRSERWDSLTLLTPNWLNGLPGAALHADPDGFLPRAGFVDYLARYARTFRAPVHEGVSVLGVRQTRGGFAVETDAGSWRARNVVVATGYADEPRVPPVAAAAPHGVLQLHSSAYCSPGQLPPGGVLVVGAGPSGQQIADELRRSGREVAIAVGRHASMPRRYRGREILGRRDRTVPTVAGRLALAGATASVA